MRHRRSNNTITEQPQVEPMLNNYIDTLVNNEIDDDYNLQQAIINSLETE